MLLLRLLPTLLPTLLQALLWHAPLAGQDPAPVQAPSITVPAFTGYSHPQHDATRRHRDGSVAQCDGSLVFYLRIANTGNLDVALARTDDAPTTSIVASLSRHDIDEPPGKTQQHTAEFTAGQMRGVLGTFAVAQAGWYRLVLATNTAIGAAALPLRNLHHLELSGAAAANLHTNTAERRNAASVHLGYDVPREHRDEVAWFYVELTPRTDPIHSYYMATGWHRGYFGMQVNSASERRLIFSVWDAGNEGHDRGKVAAADRVSLVAKGEGVVAGDFGNEGTGGHSHLVHPWRLGDTFRFLLHARPVEGATIYSGWFWFADKQAWGLIASFRAPKDGRHAHGLYSFSENFEGATGDQARDCEFGNAWVRTAGGAWLPLQQARFTHDETGNRVRSDRHGGVRGDRLFLRHGDFAEPPATAASTRGDRLTLSATAGTPPGDAELPTPPTPPKAGPR